MRLPIFVWFSMLIFFALPSHAQNDKVRVSDQPDWITRNSINYNDRQLDDEAEDGFIDLLYEEQVSLSRQAVYTRKAIRIISDAGVENYSEVSVDYDPSYSNLAFHSIKIIRGTETINKLQPSKIRILQQEMEMDRHVYNGSLTAVLLLDDLRKGDIVEYSYTVTGFNPIFKGKYTGIFQTGFSVPVYNVFYRVSTPRNRKLNIKSSSSDLPPSENHAANETFYEWRLEQLHPFRVEERIPGWYQAYSEITVSEFNGWNDVTQWALGLFNDKVQPSNELKQKIEEIRIAGLNKEKQLLGALRFVQDEVRYMGIEMGVHSHKPHDPNKVFAQRFGDCKDKTYLLCTILRGLGIESYPVLVNTVSKKGIKDWMATPSAFDHAVIRVNMNDTCYWLDPTNSHQRGRISDISFPDYGYGLVIAPGNTSLTQIPVYEPGRVKVKEIFEFPRQNGEAHLKVRTEYTGSFADDARKSFDNNSKYEMQKDFEEYYVQYFEGIKADSITYTDSDVSGKFVTIEYYTIPEIWKVEKGVKKTLFSPFVINGVLKKPKDSERTMPFSLDFPAKYEEEIEINLPEEWNAREYEQDFSWSGISFKANFRYSYRKIRLKYDYEALKDHVLPVETHDYLEGFKKAEKNIGYELSKSEENNFNYTNTVFETGSEDTSVKLTILIVVIGAIIWLVRKK